MSWIISQALNQAYENSRCSQEQEAEYSAENSLDGGPFAPLNGSPTPQAFLSPDKMTAFSRLSRFGMTFAPLTGGRGEDLLTWFREGFPARTSAPPDEAQESKEKEADSGHTWRELSVKYCRDTSLWKTHLCLWEEDLQSSSLNLPRWGMMRNGVLWERTTQALPTSENESGLWCTPAAHEPGVSAERLVPIKGGTPGGMNRHFDKRTGRMAQIGLIQQVKMRETWPTPQASDNRDRGNLGSGAIQRRKENGKQIGLSQSVSDTSGALNPPWVEWLMAWPLEWTDLKPLETARFQAWRRSHGEF